MGNLWGTEGAAGMLDSCTPFPCPKSTAYSVALGIGNNSACLSPFRALGDPAYGAEPKATVDHMKTTECFAAPPLQKKRVCKERKKKIATWPQMRVYRERFPLWEQQLET